MASDGSSCISASVHHGVCACVCVQTPTIHNMRHFVVCLLKLLHALLVGWLAFAWYLCESRSCYATHVVSCLLVFVSWMVCGFCPLTRITNRLEGVPDDRPFIPLGLERRSLVRISTFVSALLSAIGLLAESQRTAAHT